MQDGDASQHRAGSQGESAEERYSLFHGHIPAPESGLVDLLLHAGSDPLFQMVQYHVGEMLKHRDRIQTAQTEGVRWPARGGVRLEKDVARVHSRVDPVYGDTDMLPIVVQALPEL